MDKCKRCHCKRTEDDFYKNGKMFKTCYFCRAYNKNYRRRNKGIINENDFKCPRRNPVKTSIQGWISHSKQSDKNYNRFDSDGFIDEFFLNKLIKDFPNCYHCEVKLQYLKYNDTLATIERLDNSIGHIKSNCVLACRKCNLSKVGQNIINKDDFKCPRCHCKRTEDDFYKNGKKMKTCDLCRKYNKAFHEKRKNQKRCLKCNVFKDKDKFVYRKITYDSCRVCIFKACKK